MNNNHRIWILNYQSRFRLREIVVLWGVLELRGPFSWGPPARVVRRAFCWSPEADDRRGRSFDLNVTNSSGRRSIPSRYSYNVLSVNWGNEALLNVKQNISLGLNADFKWRDRNPAALLRSPARI